ncbi:MAG TPA: hypothetical protein VL051_11440, partial [Burkholderiaceae bacterium]|nr:hypothetical protein [Burkholderiaceae bacterium]
MDAGFQPEARPWIELNSPQEIEAWVDRLNHELQQIAHDRGAATAADHGRGQGVCLMLTNGGEIVLHTAADGHILLDVDNDATWVAPLIVAATGAQIPRGAIWAIPGERLIELITGLNSLIGSERLVL